MDETQNIYTTPAGEEDQSDRKTRGRPEGFSRWQYKPKKKEKREKRTRRKKISCLRKIRKKRRQENNV